MKTLLPMDAKYLGLLGPAQRTAKLLGSLKAEGIVPPPAQLNRLRGPIGIDIGAETADEIAVAIIAEIKAVASGRSAGFLCQRNAQGGRDKVRGAGVAMKVAAIILAAGASRRMGRVKQLLPYNGQSLLLGAVDAALNSQCEEVIVVLGAHADAVQSEISRTTAQIVLNDGWEAGISSSIRCGLAAAEASAPAAVLLMLADQPLIEAPTIDRLISAYREADPLVAASQYESGGETVYGVPAIFSRAVFPELAGLLGPGGAKNVITRHRHQALFVPAPEAALDVDTINDYESAVLMKINRKEYGHA
jgi:CTP:molybdopterin cytidylyltransferase MocA